MKRLVVALLLLLSGAARAQSFPVNGTALHLAPEAGSPPSFCTSPSPIDCLWFDSNSSTFQLTSGLTLPSAKTTAGTIGNWTFGGQLQGPAGSPPAQTNNWAQYVSTDVHADPWLFNHGEFTGGGLLTRPDNTMNFGWNLSGGGGLVNSGTRHGAMGLVFEQYWEQSPGDVSTAQMEFHLDYVDPTGTQHRPMFLVTSLNSPYNTNWWINATTVNLAAGIDPSTPASILLQAGQTTVTEPHALAQLIIYNQALQPGNAVLLSAGNATDGNNRGGIAIGPSGAITIQTHASGGSLGYAPGCLNDATSTGCNVQWDNSSTRVASANGNGVILMTSDPTMQVYMDGTLKFNVSPGEVSTRANTLLRLYWTGIGTSTRVDSAAAIEIDTSGATALAPQQFSPGIYFRSYAWDGSASQPRAWMIQAQNTTGATPVGKFSFVYSSDDANGTTIATLDNSGNFDAASVQIGGTSKPSCSSSTRGMIYTTEGTGGVADVTEQCLKSAADTYSWKSIVSG